MSRVTDEMLERLLEEKIRLDRLSDRLAERAQRYKKDDDESVRQRGERLEKRSNELIDQMIGLETAVNIIGYTFKYKDGEAVAIAKY